MTESTEETRKGRRYVKPAARPDTERIPAGGGFDEDWIEIRRPTLEMFERVLMSSHNNEDGARLMRLRMAALMIADWSFVDDADAKLPINYDQVAGADDQMARAIEPVLERAGDFLASRLSPSEKPATSS
jgi:hypothetical protein